MARELYRSKGAPTVLMQVRVAPDVRASAQEAAKRSDLSASLYMETLLNALRDENGFLPRVDHLVGTRGQLQLELP